jgi:hypothetical protein
MAIAQENKYTNLLGAFPNATMIDASGVGTTDGSEFAALPLNDGWEPFQQSIMDYATGSQNNPSGSVGVPNGITDSAGASQVLQAIQKAHGIGPGKLVGWFLNSDPSVTGDRVLLLQGQGVLIANYPDLDSAVWCTDVGPGGSPPSGYNAIVAAGGGSFYRSSDAAGTTPNIAGPYLQLPDLRGYVLRGLDTSGSIDPGGASRFLGDSQLDAFQGWQLGADSDLSGARNTWMSATSRDVNENSSAAASGYTLTDLRTVNQGVAPLKAMDDGVNGSPRTSSETRAINISIKYGITY